MKVQLQQYKQLDFYRPQRSCGIVMFLHASVILSTGGGGGCLADPLGRPPTPGQTPSLGQTPPRADTLPPRDGLCSERYTSYWNAFLFFVNSFTIRSRKQYNGFAIPCKTHVDMVFLTVRQVLLDKYSKLGQGLVLDRSALDQNGTCFHYHSEK